MNDLKHYDVAVVGAGPAGCSTAIGLHKSGLSVILLDKDDFPRDKPCGDAIPPWALVRLDQEMPGIIDDFLKQVGPHSFKATSLIVRSGRKLTYTWSRPGYMVSRKVLDHFLLENALRPDQIHFSPGFHVSTIEKKEDGFWLHPKVGSPIHCRVAVAADGPASVTARALTGRPSKRSSDGFGLRQYFKNLQLPDDTTSLVFFNKQYPEGYFWIFPLPGNRANVGFGLTAAQMAKMQLNPKQAFVDMIAHYPPIRRLLEEATPESSIKGHPLAFSADWEPISGDRFLLTGDAAHLVDPFTGDGIRQAIESGLHAAKSIQSAFDNKRFDSAFFTQYDQIIKTTIWQSQQKRRRMARIAAIMPWLIPAVVTLGQNKTLLGWLKKWL